MPSWRDPSSVLFAHIKAGKFASECVLRWRGDLKESGDQVSALYVYRQIYDRLGRLIANNPKLQAPNLFLSELFEWYATTNLVQAHRDAERDSKVISLANVIYEIADHPEELNYRQFLKLNGGSIRRVTRVESFSVPSIASSQARARQTAAASNNAEKVEDFRNQVSAHRARQRSITSISVEDIRSYVGTLERLTLKYERLLFGAAPNIPKPCCDGGLDRKIPVPMDSGR